MKKSALIGAASLSLISSLVLAQNSPTAAPQPYTIKIIDTSHEPGSFGFQTVTGLDDAGEVIGWYGYFIGFIPGGDSGFIYNTSDGTITLIPIPISGGTASLVPDAISNHGVIAGFYGYPSIRFGFGLGAVQFVYQNGTFTTFEVPLMSFGLPAAPTVRDVNDKGAVVGSTIRFDGTKEQGVGFLYNNGAVSYISVPGAIRTSAVAINDQGVISGNYSAPDASGVFHSHGFVDNSGRFTTIDVPGATDTNIVAMNNQAEIVGTYVTPGGATHGFVQHGNGKPTTLDVADAVSTNPVGVNNVGVVVGNYSTTNQNHGFVYDGHSTITIIEVPGATDISVVGINNNGEIAGNVSLFDNTTGKSLSRSFVAVPVPVGHTAVNP